MSSPPPSGGGRSAWKIIIFGSIVTMRKNTRKYICTYKQLFSFYFVSRIWFQSHLVSSNFIFNAKPPKKFGSVGFLCIFICNFTIYSADGSATDEVRILLVHSLQLHANLKPVDLRGGRLPLEASKIPRGWVECRGGYWLDCPPHIFKSFPRYCTVESRKSLESVFLFPRILTQIQKTEYGYRDTELGCFLTLPELSHNDGDTIRKSSFYFWLMLFVDWKEVLSCLNTFSWFKAILKRLFIICVKFHHLNMEQHSHSRTSNWHICTGNSNPTTNESTNRQPYQLIPDLDGQ